MTLKFRWETDFKETEIGEIPKGWGIKELGKIATVGSGGRAPQAEKYFIEGKYPFVRVKHLRDDKYLRDCDVITGEGAKDYNLKLYKKWVIVFPRSGESIRLSKYNIVPFDSYIVSHLAIVRGKKNIGNTDFLYYALVTFDKFIEEEIAGTTLPYLKTTDIGQRKILCPPPSEQFRIAAVLSWFDDLIENKRQQNEILKKTAMAIFKSWFIGFEPFKDEEFVDSELGKIPEGWDVRKIENFCEIVMGQSPPSIYYNEYGEGLPFIQGKGQFERFTPETDIYCSKTVKLAKPKDILVTVRAPVGELNIADKEYIIGRGVASLRSEKWVFLYLYLLTNNELLKSYERGTTYDAITKEELETFPLLIPAQPTFQKFHFLVEPLFRKILMNHKQIMVLREIRDTLLPLLVFGKLRVEEI